MEEECQELTNWMGKRVQYQTVDIKGDIELMKRNVSISAVWSRNDYDDQSVINDSNLSTHSNESISSIPSQSSAFIAFVISPAESGLFREEKMIHPVYLLLLLVKLEMPFVFSSHSGNSP